MQLPSLRLCLGLLLLASSGCELVADFDRSKIPGQNPDTGMPLPPDDDAGEADAASDDDAGGE